MLSMQNMPGGFYAMWSPGTVLLLVVIGYVYFQLIGPWRNHFAGSDKVSTSKKVYFVVALFVYYAGAGSPVYYYAMKYLFSAHMMYMALIYLIFPPLLLLSLPDWLIRPFMMQKWVQKWVKPLFHPVLAVISFNILFSFYHIPFIFNYNFNHPFIHTVYHVVLLLSAFHMWFLISCPLPEWNRLTPLQKIMYIFANGLLLTPACALIIFTGSLLYPGFTAGTESIGFWLSPLEDQRLGGTLMKVIQELVYGISIGIVFFKWYNDEKKQDEADLAKTNSTLVKPQHSY